MINKIIPMYRSLWYNYQKVCYAQYVKSCAFKSLCQTYSDIWLESNIDPILVLPIIISKNVENDKKNIRILYNSERYLEAAVGCLFSHDKN